MLYLSQVDKRTYPLGSGEWRNSDEIILSGILIDAVWYDPIGFHGMQTNYAEITSSVNGTEKAPIIFDTTDMKIICSKVSARDYILFVEYADASSNAYK